MKKATILITAGALATSLSQAATLIPSSGVSVTSSVADNGGAFAVNRVLDGLTLEGWQDGTPAPVAPNTRPSGHQGNHWISNDLTADANGDFNAVVTFNLGAAFDLAELRILNSSNTAWNDRETNEFTIQTSTDGGTSYGTASAAIALQDYTLGFQTIPLTDTGVTNVILNVKNLAAVNNHDGPFAPTFAADRGVGLNEVEFYEVTIPEPSSLILSGLGCAFLLRRRRLA